MTITYCNIRTWSKKFFFLLKSCIWKYFLNKSEMRVEKTGIPHLVAEKKIMRKFPICVTSIRSEKVRNTASQWSGSTKLILHQGQKSCQTMNTKGKDWLKTKCCPSVCVWHVLRGRTVQSSIWIKHSLVIVRLAWLGLKLDCPEELACV